MTGARADRFGCPTCLSVFRSGFPRCPLDGSVLQTLTDDPLIGFVLAERYVIEQLLGEGGMGRVYRARHIRMSRRFAIKVLFGDAAADAKARARFSREAEASSRLSHPNVVSVVDFGETEEGLLYLVMDYIEGEELHQLINREAPLGSARSLNILRQLARGLGHAHERGLIHRDFKAENVLVTRDSGEEIARIVDFGIAVVGEMNQPEQRLTTEGMVLGTPAYMSPEQSTGEEIDHRADLFSLGVMLYEMLAGRLPFDGTPLAMAKANLAARVPPISERVPGLKVDPRLEGVAMRLMAKEPESRFQSAAEILAHVESMYGRPADTDVSALLPQPGAPAVAMGAASAVSGAASAVEREATETGQTGRIEAQDTYDTATLA
ncbi:MAG TPA: serine/threonine-protein kinase, partial [Kofleriaceae bacterium]|nr:serine/threonine-protein kinase [Kofleriaceae bacterium]